MKINLLLLILITALAGLWTYLDQQKHTPNMSLPHYTDFEFNTLDGKKHTFYDYENKVTFVHFWATWCTPCLKELPELVKLAEKHPDTLTVLAFAVADKPKKIERFLSNLEISIPYNFITALDTDKRISEKNFKTKKLPETFIFKPRFILYDKIIGAEDEWNSPKWDKYIDNL